MSKCLIDNETLNAGSPDSSSVDISDFDGNEFCAVIAGTLAAGFILVSDGVAFSGHFNEIQTGTTFTAPDEGARYFKAIGSAIQFKGTALGASDLRVSLFHLGRKQP